VGIVLRLIGDSSITFRKIDNTQKANSLEDEKQHGFDHFLISSLQVEATRLSQCLRRGYDWLVLAGPVASQKVETSKLAMAHPQLWTKKITMAKWGDEIWV
jgi:hypothetical protein